MLYNFTPKLMAGLLPQHVKKSPETEYIIVNLFKNDVFSSSLGRKKVELLS
jgi:hypothetical protein